MVIACMMMVKGAQLLHTEEHVYGTGLSAVHSLPLRNPASAHHHTAISEAEGERRAHAQHSSFIEEHAQHTHS